MNKLLSRYFKENFFIIPIRKNDKRPLYKKWNEYPLSYMETRQFIKDGFNIAVVAKDLWIFDYDKRESHPISDYRDFKTLVQFTPHGFHVFLRSIDETKIKNWSILVPDNEPDTIRHGDMYCLIAPSKIDGKSYWWLDDMKGEIRSE